MRLFVLAVALAVLSGGAATATAGRSVSCDPRPSVDAFVAALDTADVAAADAVFATGSTWAWYSVADLAGRRLGSRSKDRSTLRAYFAGRIAQHERLRFVWFRAGENGNFTYLLRRRANDLRGGRAVERQGKGRVDCASGTIGVWSLGGKPPPASFGPCPSAALPLPADLAPARRAVVAFVRNVFSEMTPSLDLRGARVTDAVPAPGVPEGYAARVRCSRAVQRRTAVVRVRFPQVSRAERLSAVAFYASRTAAGWLVWRLVA